MDGFAVRASDVQSASPQSPSILNIIADIPAGSDPHVTIEPGQAARIMTGAPIPPGADAVVPVEDTDKYSKASSSSLEDQVQIFRSASLGSYIRSPGHDFKSGQTVLRACRSLHPQDIGLLAMLGLVQVPVFRLPRVALLSTGDELLLPDQPLHPGKIHDSNSYSLGGLIQESGAELIPLGIVQDDFNLIQQKLDQAVQSGADLIVSSAGVSVGTYDYVRDVIESQGSLEFWRVNMRPGKPVAFGEYRGVPVIGLPGNPVSSFIGFVVFAQPAIFKLAGREDINRQVTPAILSEAVESDGRESYLRAVVDFRDGKYYARLTGHQGSGNLFSLVQANALLIVPSGVKSLPAGSEVEIWCLKV
jgi:molybdopterin molybdotransferase